MSNESELLKALSEIVVTPDPVIEFRLYYDETGNIISTAMIEPFPEGTNYVVVNREYYDNYFRYKIVNGQVELIKYDVGIKIPFLKSTNGSYPTVKNNAALLIEANEEFDQIEYYEPRSS